MTQNIDDKYLELTYEKHRKCKIIHGNNSEYLENARRVTLGYTKAKIIVLYLGNPSTYVCTPGTGCAIRRISEG
jgi:hypothetical protein